MVGLASSLLFLKRLSPFGPNAFNATPKSQEPLKPTGLIPFIISFKILVDEFIFSHPLNFDEWTKSVDINFHNNLVIILQLFTFP
jgi:hypothetical protein